MLKKYLTTELFFCIAMFVGMPVCISYSLMDPFVTPRVILVAAFAAVFLAVLLFRKPENAYWLKSVPIISLGIFLLLFALSTAKSFNPGDAWYEWLKTFLGIPVILVTAILFRDRKSRNTLLIFSQFAVIPLVSIYIYQWLKLAYDPKLETYWGYSQHVASTLGNKNFYAELACLMLSFSIISFFTFKKFLKYFSLANIVLITVTLFAARSMAAMVSVFAGTVATGIAVYSSGSIRRFLSWKVVGIAATAIIMGGIIFFQTDASKSFSSRTKVLKTYLVNPSLADSTARENSNSTYERILLWRNSLRLIKDNPVTGCGAGNWKLIYPKYGIGGTRYIESGAVHYEHPHNDYLLIASEAGLPAAIAFILFLLSMSAIAFRNIKSKNERLWFAGILFAIVSFAITSMFSFPRVRFYSWIQLSVFIGIAFALAPTVDEKKSLQGIWKIVLAGCGILSLWAFAAGIVRYQGEMHSRLLQGAKGQRNFARIVRESAKAESWYFPVDETATPFSWYKGMSFFYSGNVAAAKVAYEDALEKNPYHIQLLNDLGTTLEQLNERDRAIEIYQRALQITPHFPHTLLNISACYFNAGKKDSAYIYIDKIYGIRLLSRDKKSYDSYLPPILREKIYADSALYTSEVRQQALVLAGDTSFVSKVYRNSKRNGKSFNQALTDSLEQK